MNLRDAETGKVLWQGTEDLSLPGVEHEGLWFSALPCIKDLNYWLRQFFSYVHYFTALFSDVNVRTRSVFSSEFGTECAMSGN